MKEVILWKLRLLMNLGKATNKGSMILWKLRLLMNLIVLYKATTAYKFNCLVYKGKAADEGNHLVEAKTVNEFNCLVLMK